MAVYSMESLAGLAPFSLPFTNSTNGMALIKEGFGDVPLVLTQESARGASFGIREGLTGNEFYYTNSVSSLDRFSAGVRLESSELPDTCFYSVRLAGDFVSAPAADVGSGWSFAAGLKVYDASFSETVKGQAPGLVRDPDGGIHVGAEGLIETYSSSDAGWEDAEPNVLTVKLVASSGDFAIYLNGLLLLEGSVSLAYPSSGSRLVGLAGRRQKTASSAWGDLVVTDTNPGQYRIQIFKPSADVESDFTPDTGSTSFSQVNETPPDGDESYISATDPGAKALFGYADPSGNPLELGPNQGVLAIKHTVQARNEVPDARMLQSVYRKDGVDTPVSGGVQVTGQYQFSSQFIDTNPATGTAWQPDDFDNWAFGVMIEEDE